MAEQTNLTERDRRIIAYCEQAWFLHSKRPSLSDLASRFNMSTKAVESFFSNEIVQKSFEGRGVPILQISEISSDQILVINTMLNLSDTRSERKKLADFGVSAATWEGWKKDPKIADYMRNRSEQILAGAIPDAHLALVDKVRAGDMSALKFYYEMTGRYTGRDAGLDPRALLTKVFDIIAKHVQQPEILQAIATDFTLLAGVDQLGNMESNSPPVAGEVVPVADKALDMGSF